MSREQTAWGYPCRRARHFARRTVSMRAITVLCALAWSSAWPPRPRSPQFNVAAERRCRGAVRKRGSGPGRGAAADQEGALVLGHYVLGHVWKLILFLSVLVMATLYAIHRTAGWLIARHRETGAPIVYGHLFRNPR
jgi:hypothetical protein